MVVPKRQKEVLSPAGRAFGDSVVTKDYTLMPCRRATADPLNVL